MAVEAIEETTKHTVLTVSGYLSHLLLFLLLQILVQ